MKKIGGKVICIASSKGGIGKTIFATNLAGVYDFLKKNFIALERKKMYKSVETVEHTIEALCSNNLFSLTFERMQKIVSNKDFGAENLSESERNEIIKGIIENVSFEEIYEWILEADYLDESFLGGDIVQCMFPQYNKKPESKELKLSGFLRIIKECL